MTDPHVLLEQWAIRDFEFYVVQLDKMTDDLAPLYALWNGRRGASAFPPKDAITPRDIRNNLKYVTLIRVLEGGKEFEYRIAGDSHVKAYADAFKINFQGKKATEMGFVTGLLDVAHRAVVATGEPRLIEFRFELANHEVFRRQALHLPLGEDGRTVDHILVMSCEAIGADVQKR